MNIWAFRNQKYTITWNNWIIYLKVNFKQNVLLWRLPAEGHQFSLPLHNDGRRCHLWTAYGDIRLSTVIFRPWGLPLLLQTSDPNASDLHCLRDQLGPSLLRAHMRPDVLRGAHAAIWICSQLHHRLHVHHFRPSTILLLHHGFHLSAWSSAGLPARSHRWNHSPFRYHSARYLHHTLVLHSLPVCSPDNR